MQDSATSSTALLVVDMQNAVLAGCIDVSDVIERVNDLMRRAREAGSKVLLVQHAEPSIEWLSPGGEGWEFDARLARHEGDIVIPKEFGDAFAATSLHQVLSDEHIERVVVTGAQSAFCVEATAMSALTRGYHVTLVSDAHTSASLALPNGQLEADQIVAFVNARFALTRHPDRSVEVLPAAQVALTQ